MHNKVEDIRHRSESLLEACMAMTVESPYVRTTISDSWSGVTDVASVNDVTILMSRRALESTSREVASSEIILVGTKWTSPHKFILVLVGTKWTSPHKFNS
jgi:hypothetical protein